MKLEVHIADTTAATMTEKEKIMLSLWVFVRRGRLFLVALVIGLSYSLIQMTHRDKVDGIDSRHRMVDPSDPPAAYRCPTDGNIYRSVFEYQNLCPTLHRT